MYRDTHVLSNLFSGFSKTRERQQYAKTRTCCIWISNTIETCYTGSEGAPYLRHYQGPCILYLSVIVTFNRGLPFKLYTWSYVYVMCFGNKLNLYKSGNQRIPHVYEIYLIGNKTLKSTNYRPIRCMNIRRFKETHQVLQ